MILEKGPVQGLSEIVSYQFTSRVIHYYRVFGFDFIGHIRVLYVDVSCSLCARSFPIYFEINNAGVEAECIILSMSYYDNRQRSFN